MDRRRPFPRDFHLLLASQSPRRHSLLRDLGIPFTVIRTEAEELLQGGPAIVLAGANARAKLLGAVLPESVIDGAFVLGTDTLVTVEDTVMGKPATVSETAQMLARLSGRTHQVVSGVALRRLGAAGGSAGSGEVLVETSVTDVTFLALELPDIEAYIASDEWRGKAGAYAVQGLAASFVSEVRGEYSNVVGLPLCLLGRMFRQAGFDLLRREWL